MLTTRSGKDVHPIGIGTWNIASKIDDDAPQGTYGAVHPRPGNEDAEIASLQYSLHTGQNHVDCAELYGAFYTDEVVGRALLETPEINREDLFIADKLWKHSAPKGQVAPTVMQMLDKLGTDYLDMIYIHAPWPGVRWHDAVEQIDDLVDQGVVRAFGVSNFSVEQMTEAQTLSSNGIAANQMHFNCLYRSEVDTRFESYCRENGINIVAYQPLKRGEVLTNPVVQRVAAAHDATPAQVALAWLISRGAFPIPKAVTKAHIDENLGALSLSLTDADLEMLDEL